MCRSIGTPVTSANAPTVLVHAAVVLRPHVVGVLVSTIGVGAMLTELLTGGITRESVESE